MSDQKSAADDRKQKLDVLLRDYDLLRGDERNQTAIYFTTFSIAIGTLVLLAGLLYQILDDSGERPPDFILIGAPLIPLCLFVHLLTVAPAAVARAFYGRLLERQIQSMVDVRSAYPGLRFPSFMELNVTYSRFTRVTVYRTILALIATIIIVIFLGMTMALIFNTESYISKLVAIPFYGVTTWLVVSTWVRLNKRGRDFFSMALDNYREDRLDSLLPRDSNAGVQLSRTFFLYLLVPRPSDLSKALFFPIGVGIGSLLSLQMVDIDLRFIAMWLTLEMLLYSARYQINDIRGASEDGKAPEKQARMRPQMMADEMKASAAVVVVRIYVAFLVAVAPTLGLGWNMLWAFGCVAVSAIVYEAARSFERTGFMRSSADRHEGGELVVSVPQTALAVFVLMWVGVGYPIRLALGLFFAAPGVHSVQVTLGLLVFTFFFGLLFVTMTWALESMSYLVSLPGEDEKPRLNWAIAEKPHLVVLFTSFRWKGLPAVGTNSSVAQEPPGSTLPAFRRLYEKNAAKAAVRTASTFAPWNIALTGCAVGVGILLSAPTVNLGVPWLAMTLTLLAISVVVVSQRRFDWICAVVAVLPILSVVGALVGSHMLDNRLGNAGADVAVCSIAVFGWMLAIAFTIVFGFSTYDSILGTVPKLLGGCVTLMRGAVLVIFGKHFVDSTRLFDTSPKSP